MNHPVRPVRIDLSAARLLLCGYGLFALVEARVPTPGCPYRLITGRRCPACGLTGSVAAALRGRIRRAAVIHRLGPAVAGAVLVAGISTALTTMRSSNGDHGRAPTRLTAAAPAAQPAVSAAR